MCRYRVGADGWRLWATDPGHQPWTRKRGADTAGGRIIRELRAAGWVVKRDPDFSSWHIARRRGLGASLQLDGQTLDVDFWPSPNPFCTNRNGPRYAMREERQAALTARSMLWIRVAVRRLTKVLAAAGYADASVPRYADHAMRFEFERRSCVHRWDAPRYTYNCRDGDGRIMGDGDYRWGYARGRLIRGQVFKRLNSTWVMLAGGRRYHLDGHPFTPDGDPPRRWFSVERRKGILERHKARAVKLEEYERAAVLRDVIRGLAP